MKSIISAKKKVSRKYVVNLWGDPNSPFEKRSYAPGQHGQRRKKSTDYGTQLSAKQKLKTYYGNISEKQFHKYYVEAIRRSGDAAENLIGLLESRLKQNLFRQYLLLVSLLTMVMLPLMAKKLTSLLIWLKLVM